MTTYEDAGVVLEKAKEISGMLDVHTNIDEFCARYRFTKNYEIISTTDGIGTKTLFAIRLNDVVGLGYDIVHHCINDILCAGRYAKPIMFQNYIASGRLDVIQTTTIIASIMRACENAGIKSLGGEFAEMPDIYYEDAIDVVGTIIGLNDPKFSYPLPGIEVGDIAFGLYSYGPHTNGYSLIRKIFDNVPRLLNEFKTELLVPHKNYQPVLERLEGINANILAVAHITGGGIIENCNRVIQDGLKLELLEEGWEIPKIFKIIQTIGRIPETEMQRVFNMGIGMVVFAKPYHLIQLNEALGDEGQLIGYIIEE